MPEYWFMNPDFEFAEEVSTPELCELYRQVDQAFNDGEIGFQTSERFRQMIDEHYMYEVVEVED